MYSALYYVHPILELLHLGCKAAPHACKHGWQSTPTPMAWVLLALGCTAGCTTAGLLMHLRLCSFVLRRLCILGIRA